MGSKTDQLGQILIGAEDRTPSSNNTCVSDFNMRKAMKELATGLRS